MQKVRSTGSIIRGHVRGTCPRLSAHDVRRQSRHSLVTLAVLWLFVAFDHNNAMRRMNTISGLAGFIEWLPGVVNVLTFNHLSSLSSACRADYLLCQPTKPRNSQLSPNH